jgi:hypothetical protein
MRKGEKMAYAILRFGAEERVQFGEELVGLPFVHLFEVGYPLLLGHLGCSLCGYWIAYVLFG